MRRQSRWTAIYWDAHNGVLKPYIRLVPDFMELERAGASHGLSFGQFYDNEAEAVKQADFYDKFFDALATALKEADDEGC